MLGQFPPTLETNASKATAYVRLAFHNLGFDYYDKYLAGIQAVTGQLGKRRRGRPSAGIEFRLGRRGESH